MVGEDLKLGVKVQRQEGCGGEGGGGVAGREGFERFGVAAWAAGGAAADGCVVVAWMIGQRGNSGWWMATHSFPNPMPLGRSSGKISGLQSSRKCGRKPPISFFKVIWKNVAVESA